MKHVVIAVATQMAVLMAAWWGGAAQAGVLYVTTDTFLKASTDQASALPALQQCAFTAGQALEYSTVSDAAADHYSIVLPRTYANCGLASGYLYRPHVSLPAMSITVHTATTFKKTTADASTLPAASKCTMPAGVYPLSSASTSASGHLSVNLKSLLPNCSFSAGYVYTGHALAGVNVLSLASSVYLKTSTADSSTLPDANKCLIAAGNYLMTSVPTVSGTHYNVSLNAKPANCGLQKGYVYYELTLLAAPGSGSSNANYIIPMNNGVAYSGDFSWCVCRDIGTSPHIGQDWNASGFEASRAVANGKIVDKTFVSGCGHYLLLEDATGARWRYLHLNANDWQIGDTVRQGEQLGVHGDYPIVGQCGSGPHLHLERRSAGGFNDSEVFKTCQFGTSTCYYNPNKPFPGAGAASVVATTAAQSVTENTAPAFNVTVARSHAGKCSRDVDTYPLAEIPAAARATAGTTAQQRNLRVEPQIFKEGDVTHVALRASIEGNTQNQCGAGKSCLISWQAYVDTPQGTKRLFTDAAVRNRPAEVMRDAQLCLPADAAGRVHVLAKDIKGQTYYTAVPLQ